MKNLEHLVAAFQPRDPVFRANPYPVYEALRRDSPLHYDTVRSVWFISRYRDVEALLKDPRIGHAPRNYRPVPSELANVPLMYRREEAVQLLNLWASDQNPPDHTRLRRLLQKAFTTERIHKLQARSDELAEACLDRAESLGSLDVVADLGRPIPFTITCDTLGVPNDLRPRLQNLVQELHTSIDIDTDSTAHPRGVFAMMGLAQCFRGLVAEWRLQPPQHESLVWELNQAVEEGHLTEIEFIAQCTLFLFGGYMTTQHLVGNSVLALLRHPDQLALLRAQPGLLEQAIVEFLRYNPPTQVVVRTALSDVEIGGVTIREGQRIRLLLASANRDADVFPDPDKLDITRAPRPNLSFGHGIHFCLGSALSKMNGKAAIGALLRRFSVLRFEPEKLEWDEVFVIHGLKSLPVTFS